MVTHAAHETKDLYTNQTHSFWIIYWSSHSLWISILLLPTISYHDLFSTRRTGPRYLDTIRISLNWIMSPSQSFLRTFFNDHDSRFTNTRKEEHRAHRPASDFSLNLWSYMEIPIPHRWHNHPASIWLSIWRSSTSRAILLHLAGSSLPQSVTPGL